MALDGVLTNDEITYDPYDLALEKPTWNAIDNPRRFFSVVVAICLAFTFLCSCISPKEAHAETGIGIVDAIGSLAIGLGNAVTDAASGVFNSLTAGVDFLTDPAGAIRDGANANLAAMTASMNTQLSSEYLIGSLDTIFALDSDGDQGQGVVDTGPYALMKNVHQKAAVPLANVVLLIFLVAGLGKQISNAGRTETGVDMWQIMLVFIMYTAMKIICDSSWEILELAYNIVNSIIVLVGASGDVSLGTSFVAIPDEVNSFAPLMTLWITSFIAMLASMVCSVCMWSAMVIRLIQVYIYTAFSPIPLATAVSESGRPMATGFLKRYAAILLSGVIMAGLLLIFPTLVKAIMLTPEAITDGAKYTTYLYTIVYNLALIAICTWSMFRSGAWARDFVGV